jgi:hypothetical protein
MTKTFWAPITAPYMNTIGKKNQHIDEVNLIYSPITKCLVIFLNKWP